MRKYQKQLLREKINQKSKKNKYQSELSGKQELDKEGE